MGTIRSVTFVEGRIANKNQVFNQIINQVSLEEWLYGISSYIDFVHRYWFSISLLNTLCNEIDAISGRRVLKR